jgi:hypothetical protein
MESTHVTMFSIYITEKIASTKYDMVRTKNEDLPQHCYVL